MDASVHKIRAFVTAARVGGLTRAAEELGCTQSTASRMIASLEAGWGVRLFSRRGTGVALTAEGVQLLPHAQEVCQAYERLCSQVSRVRDSGAGALAIAAPASIVSRRLPGVIRSFVRLYPGVELNVFENTYAEAERALRANEVDIAFLPSRVEGPEFDSVLFDRDELVVVAPVGHLPPEPRELTLEDLVSERFVADSETAPVLQKRLTEPSIRCTTSDVTAILSLVEAGLGVSLLPSLALGGYAGRVDVRHLKTPAWRAIYVVCRPRNELSVPAIRFLECLGVQ